MYIEYKPASADDLEFIWNKNIDEHPGDGRYFHWKEEFIYNNRTERARTYLILCSGSPIGEGTLLFSPECGAIRGRTQLADGVHTANINALRIQKPFEGKGYVSGLIRFMEKSASQMGYSRLTIGVQAQETRNLAIYLHLGYTQFIHNEVEDGALVLYYQKCI